MTDPIPALAPSVSEADVYDARLAGQLADLMGAYRPRFIDLFCGAGGLTAGFTHFEGHLCEPVWANDSNKNAIETYNRNFGDHGIHGDLEDLLDLDSRSALEVPAAEIVVGGPPCQGFSLLNRNRDGDSRRHLWIPFMEVVKRSSAEVFVTENVPQFLGSGEYEDFVAEATSQGFFVASAILCAADYGVPQTRWRAFVLGSKSADPMLEFPPKRTHRMPEGRGYRRLFNGYGGEYVADPDPWVTVEQAIGNLSEPSGTKLDVEDESPFGLHFGRQPTEVSLTRYATVPAGGNRFDLQRSRPDLTPRCWLAKPEGGTDLFGRLWTDRPAVTIRTEFFKPEKGRYLHPSENRAITHREAARLQSFGDAFRFFGSKSEIARQIGNAVPPRLAARVADSVIALLLRSR